MQTTAVDEIDADLAAVAALRALPEPERQAVLADASDPRTLAHARVQRRARALEAMEERLRAEKIARVTDRRTFDEARAKLAVVLDVRTALLRAVDEAQAISASEMKRLRDLDAQATQLYVRCRTLGDAREGDAAAGHEPAPPDEAGWLAQLRERFAVDFTPTIAKWAEGGRIEYLPAATQAAACTLSEVAWKRHP